MTFRKFTYGKNLEYTKSIWIHSWCVWVHTCVVRVCVCVYACCSLCLKTLSMLTWFISSFNWVSSFLFNWVSSSNWVSCRKISAKFYNMKEFKSHVYTPVYKIADYENPCVVQGSLLRAVWWPWWREIQEGGHMCVYI